MTKLLKINASMRYDGSATRQLVDEIASRFPEAEMLERDLAHGIPLIDEAWIGANFTDLAERTEEQRAALARSDTLVAELKAADVLVIGLPVYNFGVPAAFKAWIDQVARARVTFRYTENGPVGLLEGKRAIIAVASGGTELGSRIDFVTPYIRHVLGFLGIRDVEVIGAGQQMMNDGALEAARARIAGIAA